jgi:hypothetical protein
MAFQAFSAASLIRTSLHSPPLKLYKGSFMKEGSKESSEKQDLLGAFLHHKFLCATEPQDCYYISPLIFINIEGIS